MFKTYTKMIFTIPLILVFGCNRTKGGVSDKQVKEIQAASDDLSKIDNFVYEAPLFLGDGSLAQLRKLPTLKSESVEFKEGANSEGVKLEFRTFKFDGLELYGDVEDGKLQPISITVTGPQWKILHGLSVGTLASRVPQALGLQPRPMKGPVEEFSGETETVIFTVSDGKIRQIEFSYYFD